MTEASSQKAYDKLVQTLKELNNAHDVRKASEVINEYSLLQKRMTDLKLEKFFVENWSFVPTRYEESLLERKNQLKKRTNSFQITRA